ncbi:MAG: histidine kinase [Chitinophagaceae bacterium]|nr:histidine kinase [Chitinophagaceae bacterium]
MLSCVLFQRITAQTEAIDSLKKILPSLKGSARVDCLNELGAEYADRYWTTSQYLQTDTGLLYTIQAMNEAGQLHYAPGIGKANLNMSIIEEEHNNLVVATDYLRKAIPVLQKENRTVDFHRGRAFLGWCSYRLGLIEQSISIYHEELPYYEGTRDTLRLAKLYRMIARAYNSQGNSEKAFTYLQKDFAVNKPAMDTWGKRSTATLQAVVYMAAGDTENAVLYYKQAALVSKNQRSILASYQYNMAVAFILEKKYDSALFEIRNAIAEIQSSKDDSLYRKLILTNNYTILSDILFSLKQYDSAIIYGRRAMLFYKKCSDVPGLLSALKTLAAAHNSKNENAAALLYASQLLAYAKKSGARPFERDAYKILWHICSNQQKANEAKNYHLKYTLLNNDLRNDKYISQSAAWKAINDISINEVKYENQLKLNEERSNVKIASIKEEKKVQLYTFIAAIALISIFTILMIRNNRLKRKRDQLQLMMTEANIALEKQKREQEIAQWQQQKTELEMQALRAQMNPHFIFNCLNSINRFIMNNDAAKAADYLTKFAKLIRIVLEQSGKPFVSLEDEIFCLRLYMDLEALRFEPPFKYEIHYNGSDAAAIMIPTLLMQPFVENAIWHGLRGKEHEGKIDISIHRQENILLCRICDNGIGRAAASKEKINTEKKSFGINLTQHRLQLINFNSQNEPAITFSDLANENGQCAGTCVDISIPVKET